MASGQKRKQQRRAKQAEAAAGLTHTPDAGRGSGGQIAMESRSDLRIAEQAVKNGWQIPEKAMEQLPSEILEIALDSKRDDRSRIAAARVLTAMHGQNQTKPSGGTTVNVAVVNNNADLYD